MLASSFSGLERSKPRGGNRLLPPTRGLFEVKPTAGGRGWNDLALGFGVVVVVVVVAELFLARCDNGERRVTTGLFAGVRTVVLGVKRAPGGRRKRSSGFALRRLFSVVVVFASSSISSSSSVSTVSVESSDFNGDVSLLSTGSIAFDAVGVTALFSAAVGLIRNRD